MTLPTTNKANKRKASSSSDQTTSKQARLSPSSSPFSPPHSPARLNSAAQAQAAIKRGSSSNVVNNTPPLPPPPPPLPRTLRQGSVEETEELEHVEVVKKDKEAEEDEKEEEVMVMDMDTHMQAQLEKNKQDMKLLLESFSDEQLQRYEAYRRSALNRTNVKRLVTQVLNQQCSPTMAFVVAGFSKVYVGEIIEKAREIMEEWGHEGAIRPEHLREAHRRYKKEHQQLTHPPFIGKRL